MAAPLKAFLEAAEARPFVWGQWDCSLFPAAWIRELTGIDPARRWRGLYDTQEGALGFIEQGRGLARVFQAAAAEAGLRRALQPVLGAVGVIRSDDPQIRLMGAVCVQPGFWATVAPQGGIVAARTKAVVAWEI